MLPAGHVHTDGQQLGLTILPFGNVGIAPGYPHPASIPGDVLVLIVLVFIRIALDIINHGGRVKAFGILFGHDGTHHRFAHQFMPAVAKQFLTKPVDGNDPSLTVPAKKNAVRLFHQLAVEPRLLHAATLHRENEWIPLPDAIENQQHAQHVEQGLDNKIGLRGTGDQKTGQPVEIPAQVQEQPQIRAIHAGNHAAPAFLKFPGDVCPPANQQGGTHHRHRDQNRISDQADIHQGSPSPAGMSGKITQECGKWLPNRLR